MGIPSDHVLIDNLPGDFDEAGLKMVFGSYGNIKWCRLQPDRMKAGKQCAMIELDSIEAATFLVENLNGQIPQGLMAPVTVKYKMPKAPGGAPGLGGNRYSPYGSSVDAWGKGIGKGGGSAKQLVNALLKSGALPGGKWENDERTIYVGGLPQDTTDLDLYKIFSPFGALQPGGVRAMTQEDGTCKGFGFINFQEMSSAEASKATLNMATMPDGTVLKVRSYAPAAPKQMVS
mmetsp:Transcript_64573/g.154281  ORF Transcript_64573/g.154281 Transcript_64573/m.154281 type:complete len:232 (+) Transcript_64573:93-788(+)